MIGAAGLGENMSIADNQGVLIIGSGAVLKGQVRDAKRVEVHGYVDGGINANDVFIADDGKVSGQVRSVSAEVRGMVQGDVRVAELMTIKATGSVAGTMKYGRLIMEEGAELAAEVRNIPPAISGDLDLTVRKGRSVRITQSDLTAVDPDDRTADLSFEVTGARGGFITQAGAPGLAIQTFTQADLEAGRVHFAHDGGNAETASFNIVVTDKSGANSGLPKTVNVAVRT